MHFSYDSILNLASVLPSSLPAYLPAISISLKSHSLPLLLWYIVIRYYLWNPFLADPSTDTGDIGCILHGWTCPLCLFPIDSLPIFACVSYLFRGFFFLSNSGKAGRWVPALRPSLLFVNLMSFYFLLSCLLSICHILRSRRFQASLVLSFCRRSLLGVFAGWALCGRSSLRALFAFRQTYIRPSKENSGANSGA